MTRFILFAFILFIFIFLIYEAGRLVGFMEASEIFEVICEVSFP